MKGCVRSPIADATLITHPRKPRAFACMHVWCGVVWCGGSSRLMVYCGRQVE